MKSKPAATSAVDILEKIKSYTEFESVTIHPDGTVAVTFAGKQSPVKKKKDEAPIRKTAIDSLSETPPAFQFGN